LNIQITPKKSVEDPNELHTEECLSPKMPEENNPDPNISDIEGEDLLPKEIFVEA
jgi:hypothetical protein